MLELVPDAPRVFPVGRLDADSEGLLVLTNDGELAQRLTHPSFGVEKEYLVEVEGVPSAGDLRRLRQGVDLDDGKTAPATVGVVAPGVLRIVIHEGRNRQIRRMCDAVGHPVRRLVRTRIGPLSDPRLKPGHVAGARPAPRCAPWAAPPPTSTAGATALASASTRRGRAHRAWVASRPMSPVRALAVPPPSTPTPRTRSRAACRSCWRDALGAQRPRPRRPHQHRVHRHAATWCRCSRPRRPGPWASGTSPCCAPASSTSSGPPPAACGSCSTSTTDRARPELHHVYLHGARGLRDDLPE